MFNIKGMILGSEPMWRHTTFLAGGPADLFAVPADEEDLRLLLAAAGEAGMDIFVLGGGSNILVADSGIRGLTIDTRLFRDYRLDSRGTAARGNGGAGNDMAAGGSDSRGPAADGAADGKTAGDAAAGESLLVLGAGLRVSDAAWRSGSSGLKGLDFLFGMPGSVGGALWMNARCYDEEIADKVAWVEVMNRAGTISRLPMRRKNWSYKHSPFQSAAGRDLIILRAAFTVSPGAPGEIKKSMREKRDDREKKGHYRAPCAGSAFKNNRAFGAPSGVLIDNCGLKGLKIGRASVAPWHGNIIINEGGARASDIRGLLEKVAAEVEQSTGFRMESEILMRGGW